MDIKDLKFRKEERDDYRAVEELTRDAFWNIHAPGCEEHYLVYLIREADCFIPDLDIVAELNEKIVANIMYTESKIQGEDGKVYPVVTFGPISVLPSYQRMGIGRKIIEYSIAIAKDMGYNAVLIYGDPDYYSKVGFIPAEEFNIGTAYDTYAAALQVRELTEGALQGISAKFYEDPAYSIDVAAVKEYDKGFAKKELIEGTMSQQRFQEILKMSKPR